jgi:hypothetical protein
MVCRLAPFLVFFVATVGCSTASPEGDDVADANSGMTEGVVLVERASSADGTVQTNVSAKFMRLSAPVDVDLAERVVGARLDLPALGTCRVDAAAREKVGNNSRPVLGPIELLDVGDVSLVTGASRLALGARAFPDVGELVSGMFYTAPDAATELPWADTYTLQGTGSALVEHFAIQVEAPPPPSEVRIGGLPLNSAVVDTRFPTAVDWDGQPRGDQVVVDIGVPSGASVHCAFKDSGKAILPSLAVIGSRLGPLPSAGSIRVHRLRQRTFTAVGLDAAELRFDLSVTGHVTFVGDEPTASPPSPGP